MSSMIKQDDLELLNGSIVEFGGSELFMRTFEEGMAMVEETAAYLDGAGRQESRNLPSAGSLAYAGESMRLTTRLMQVASWLLVQRSVFDGEMSLADASSDKYRLGSKEICRAAAMDGAEMLPPKLQDLLERSSRLYERVDRLDEQLYRRTESAVAVVGDHLKKLQNAFSLSGGDD